MNRITNRYHTESVSSGQRLHRRSEAAAERPRGGSLVLPRIIRPRQEKLSEEEISKVGERVLKLQKMWYGPKGCSKSINLEKVLLKKKINRKIKVEEQKTALLDWLEDDR
jgi:hypothetical protein